MPLLSAGIASYRVLPLDMRGLTGAVVAHPVESRSMPAPAYCCTYTQTQRSSCSQTLQQVVMRRCKNSTANSLNTASTADTAIPVPSDFGSYK
jgi:hypothetical protein